MQKKKPGRKPKYSTEKERKEAHSLYRREWYLKNKKRSYAARRGRIRKLMEPPPADFSVRLDALEKKIETFEDIMDLKELFNDLAADFQKLKDEVRWGKR